MMASSNQSLAQDLNLNPSEAHDISGFIIEGYECKMDRDTYAEELVRCQGDLASTEPQFWQKPEFIIGGVTVSFAMGLIAGLTHCLGLCQ